MPTTKPSYKSGRCKTTSFGVVGGSLVATLIIVIHLYLRMTL